MKPCPSCGRRIQDAALKCHYCGTVVRQPRVASEAHKTEKPQPKAKSSVEKLPLPFRVAIVILVLGATLAWLVW